MNELIEGKHRRRTLFVLFVYLVYFALSISGLVSLGNGNERYALVLAVVLPVAHLTTALYAMLANDRRALTSNLDKLVLAGDWLQAVALGLAANSVNRSNEDGEAAAATVAHLLLLTGQLICFAKTRDLLNSVCTHAHVQVVVCAAH